jgi:fused signal recognition particle receptor
MDPTAVVLPAAAVATALGAGLAWALSRRRRGARPAAPSSRRAVEEAGSLRRGLAAAGRRLATGLEAALGRGPRPLDEVLGELEEVLVGGDVGMATASALIERVRGRLGRDAGASEIRAALREEMTALIEAEPMPEPANRPWVVLVTGVNGVGKTTTIGKLATLHAAAGRRVLLVAADTFRAAAIDQLAVWAERTGAGIVRHDAGADPSAVVFDGMKAALARNVDVVLVDTAGRLQTRVPLMEELRKIRRVIAREVPGGPHQTLLVLDATTGQNALSQARTFSEAAEVTGVVLAKLDGTAKGGVVLAIRRELGLPIRYVGVGEGAGDLQPFDAGEFVDALLKPSADPTSRVDSSTPETLQNPGR